MKPSGKPKLELLLGARVLGGFQKFAGTVVHSSGHPIAFGLAICVIGVWLLTGVVLSLWQHLAASH